MGNQQRDASSNGRVNGNGSGNRDRGGPPSNERAPERAALPPDNETLRIANAVGRAAGLVDALKRFIDLMTAVERKQVVEQLEIAKQECFQIMLTKPLKHVVDAWASATQAINAITEELTRPAGNGQQSSQPAAHAGESEATTPPA
jgi:hypothetical protein